MVRTRGQLPLNTEDTMRRHVTSVAIVLLAVLVFPAVPKPAVAATFPLKPP